MPLQRYCAFLRGINIGKSVMKMVEVCTVFEQAGMSEVSSVLATGNILFSDSKDTDQLKLMLEKKLSEHFNYEAFLFLKNENEIRTILDSCPFHKEENMHIYVFITSPGFEVILLEEFEKINPAEEENGVIQGNTFYWQLPKGSTLNSEFGKILGKKNFKDQFTSRNINTFKRILSKM